jgi:hypothetical protein
MAYSWKNALKAKAKCNLCGDVIVAESNIEWTECSCGSTKVKGTHLFKAIQGPDFQDLTLFDFSQLPPHKEWDK